MIWDKIRNTIIWSVVHLSIQFADKFEILRYYTQRLILIVLPHRHINVGHNYWKEVSKFKICNILEKGISRVFKNDHPPPLSPSARKVFYLKYIGNIFLYPNVIVDLYKHISSKFIVSFNFNMNIIKDVSKIYNFRKFSKFMNIQFFFIISFHGCKIFLLISIIKFVYKVSIKAWF